MSQKTSRRGKRDAGEENKVADALSRIYSDEPEGMVRAESEYLKEDEDSEEQMQVSHINYNVRAPLTCPLYVGNAAVIPDEPQETRKRPEKPRRAWANTSAIRQRAKAGDQISAASASAKKA
ncbi:hypothetical protein RhiLY_07785 [Ceratobasidium sp. AG-Ba]|nr:hypothetical protein RhiLY_07785 [Ceratobasidium sp. AG-Ba]